MPVLQRVIAVAGLHHETLLFGGHANLAISGRAGGAVRCITQTILVAQLLLRRAISRSLPRGRGAAPSAKSAEASENSLGELVLLLFGEDGDELSLGFAFDGRDLSRQAPHGVR